MHWRPSVHDDLEMHGFYAVEKLILSDIIGLHREYVITTSIWLILILEYIHYQITSASSLITQINLQRNILHEEQHEKFTICGRSYCVIMDDK